MTPGPISLEDTRLPDLDTEAVLGCPDLLSSSRIFLRSSSLLRGMGALLTTSSSSSSWLISTSLVLGPLSSLRPLMSSLPLLTLSSLLRLAACW